MVREQGTPQREPLSRSELATRAKQLVTDFAETIIPPLREQVRKGEGKQSLGSVPGREGEHLLGIDTPGQAVLINLLRERELPAYVLGEHSPRNVMEFGEPQMIIAIDPFDNSRQYKKGQDTSVYSVVSIYGLNGKPLAGVVCDIKDRRSYVGFGGTNYLYDHEDRTEFRQLRPIPRTTITDDEASVATYLAEEPYRELFIAKFRELMKNMKGIFYTGGGAYIYGLLASGAVDAYVMFDEPYSEILPGFTLARFAGLTVVSVNLEDGTYTDFRFDPSLAADPERYASGTVPLFIAASTPELTEEIIGYYLRANNIDTQPRKIKNGNSSGSVMPQEP